MKNFEILEHTADIKIKARASTKEELFEVVTEALCEIMYPGFKKSQPAEFTEKHNFNIESVDSSALLIELLSEQLSLMHTYNILLPKVEIALLEEDKIAGHFYGYEIESFHEDVKAVTYHEAELKVNQEKQYEIIILLDI